MGQKERGEGRSGLSRRDFFKVSAASAAAASALDFAPVVAKAITPTGGDTAIIEKISTCPYCSAQCGQVVSVGDVTGKVYDIWGDPNSPTNRGGLCAKGAGSYQLATNSRRLGVDGFPTDPNFATQTYPEASRSVFNYSTDSATVDTDKGCAYKRVGNGPWNRIKLTTALSEAAAALVTARGGAPSPGLTSTSNKKGVQFFGSSHINNEANYLYRKIVANFGTSCIEHQARI